jgi:hypothetical protein
MKSNPPPREGLYGVIKDLVRGPVHALLSQLHGEPAAARPPMIEVLEYFQLLEYAAAKKIERPEIVATLVRRELTPNAWLFTQVFLDRADNLIQKDGKFFGRVVLAKAVDDELSELFDDAESVTVELP